MQDFLLLQDSKTLKLIQALSPALAYNLVSWGPGGAVSVEVARKEQKKSKQIEILECQLAGACQKAQLTGCPGIQDWSPGLRTGRQGSVHLILLPLPWFSVPRLTPTSMSAEGTAPRDASLTETVGAEWQDEPTLFVLARVPAASRGTGTCSSDHSHASLWWGLTCNIRERSDYNKIWWRPRYLHSFSLYFLSSSPCILF